jgi:hypothetical protein
MPTGNTLRMSIMGRILCIYLSPRAFSRRDNTTLRIFSKLAMSCSACGSFHSALYAVEENVSKNGAVPTLTLTTGAHFFAKTDRWDMPSSPS